MKAIFGIIFLSQVGLREMTYHGLYLGHIQLGDEIYSYISLLPEDFDLQDLHHVSNHSNQHYKNLLKMLNIPFTTPRLYRF